MILSELRYPIVQAPVAGGPATAALSAAVGDAGGLGFLAAGYRTVEAMRADIRDLRGRTAAPFGVNVFVLNREPVDQGELSEYLELLKAEASRYGVDVGEPRWDDDGFDAKLAAVMEERPPVVSFTFGCPSAEVIRSLRDAGSEVWVTVTTVAEARTAMDAGADALVLQGAEAGGHRASFVDGEAAEDLGLLPLLRLVAGETDLPLIAAGGLTDGRAIAGILAAGAAAAQVGTAFLRAPEAGTHPAHRDALATERPTAITRAFTGRRARGLVNRFVLEHSDHAPAACPQVHHATGPIRAAARDLGDADGFNLWAGQAHRLARELPAAEIVRSLGLELEAALEEATARFAPLQPPGPSAATE